MQLICFYLCFFPAPLFGGPNFSAFPPAAAAPSDDLDGPLSPMATHFKMPGQWNKANTMRSGNSQQQQQQHRERVIPIQIEGRPPQVS